MSSSIPGKVEFLVPLATMMCSMLISQQYVQEHLEKFGVTHQCDMCNAAKMLALDVEKRILSVSRSAK